MDKDERDKALEKFRSALKAARNERSVDRNNIGWDLADAESRARDIGYSEPAAWKKFDKIVDQASGRGMLVKDVVEVLNTDGKLVSRKMEISEGKSREPYQKRPSVRAFKKQRSASKGRSIEILRNAVKW